MAGALKKLYLLGYNLGCAAGWVYCLYLLFINRESSYAESWAKIGLTLKIVQSVAILEIAHSMIGLVRSPVLTTLLQVMSRLVVVHIYMDYNEGLGFVLAAISWSLVEVPRYLFYAFNIFGKVPYPIFWLRYSLFAILYPSGITGELLTVWSTLGALKKTMVFGNGDFFLYSMTLLILGMYVPGSPFMYGHMVHQRKSNFKKRANKKKD